MTITRRPDKRSWTPRQKQVAALLTDRTKTNADVARQLGISRERVRQIVIEIGGVRPRISKTSHATCVACHDEIVQARTEGTQYQVIADELGVPYNAVRDYCTAIGVNTRKLEAERFAAWVQMYVEGRMTCREIAEATGWRFMTVYRQLARRVVIRDLSEVARMRHAKRRAS